MTKWRTKIRLVHLMTEKEDWSSVQESMNAIADVLDKSDAFKEFDIKDFRNIPKGDDVFGPADYADKLIIKMYDFADAHLIWVE